jgi:hypothetical protein
VSEGYESETTLRKNDALRGEATKIEWRDNHACLGGDLKEALRRKLANTRSYASWVAEGEMNRLPNRPSPPDESGGLNWSEPLR